MSTSAHIKKLLSGQELSAKSPTFEATPSAKGHDVRALSSYPANVPCWIDTAQPDPAAAADFYGRLFGWELTEAAPGYLVATIEGSQVAGIAAATSDTSTPGWTTYVRVDDADTAVGTIEAAGGRRLLGPVEHPGAGRRAVCADPDGATFGVVHTAGPLVALRVNEPGTWNFSELQTPDIERAITFYREVFGWQSDPVDMGSGEAWMVRRPGYGDVLEQHRPGTKASHLEFGAPPGFTDAVAWIGPRSDPAAAPQWHLTFAVDDADDVTARAVDLGGTVLSEPVDAGVVRMAALRDPQGVAFTVSRFDPS